MEIDVKDENSLNNTVSPNNAFKKLYVEKRGKVVRETSPLIANLAEGE